MLKCLLNFLLILATFLLQLQTSFAAAGDDTTSASMRCSTENSQTVLRRIDTQEQVATYENKLQCNAAREAAHDGIVCVWFTPDMPVGPGGWNETGWRPMNTQTKLGLGRRPHKNFEDCLSASRNANGGVVCTNTGVGYKSANISTNHWCGASSQLTYCVKATKEAKQNYVCTFPSDGSGAEAGWVVTRVTSACEYIGTKRSISECNKNIPN